MWQMASLRARYFRPCKPSNRAEQVLQAGQGVSCFLLIVNQAALHRRWRTGSPSALHGATTITVTSNQEVCYCFLCRRLGISTEGASCSVWSFYGKRERYTLLRFCRVIGWRIISKHDLCFPGGD